MKTVRNAVWLLGLAAILPMACSAQGARSTAKPAASDQFPLVRLTGPMRIAQNTRIAPGTYRMDVADRAAVIEIDADNVELDLTGVTLESSAANPWERVGVGVHSEGHSHVTVRGGAIRGYRFGMLLGGDSAPAADIKVIGTDVSGSRGQRLLSTPTHYDENDWVDIFKIESWESYGGGLYLKNVDGAWIEGVTAHGAQNGILLAKVTHATIYRSDLSHNSGWGIALWNSSWNDLLENHADWDVRCESSSYSHGCDSAGVLLMDASNRNRIVGNSFTHSGDGYFLSGVENGPQSDYNYVAWNDGSYSPHNAFESTFSEGDEFDHNIADHSDYGFWLGFSRATTVADNHIEGSKRDAIAIEHGSGNNIVRNQIIANGTSGIRLFRGGTALEPSERYAILENNFTGNPAALILERTQDVSITANTFANNKVGLKLESGNAGIRLQKNRFTPQTAKKIETADPSAITVQIP
jgi:parallel beta-helix repeat protein